MEPLMYQALENSLFVRDREKFEQLRNRAEQFNKKYNGENIIQDDIFHVMENYSEKQGMVLEFLRYPVEDEELCACTFVRGGKVFVMMNSALPLSRQIFAAGHELYHLYCYFEGEDQDFYQHGSILKTPALDDASTAIEEMEANAFAGLLLAPASQLLQQMKIYGIKAEKIALQEVLMLMEIFAIPHKAVILRLFEEGILSEERVRELFRISSKDVQRQIDLTGRSARWVRASKDVLEFGSLRENMAKAVDLKSVEPARLRHDKARLKDLEREIRGPGAPDKE